MNYSHALICFTLVSCTPIEREIAEEAVEVAIDFEKGVKAPVPNPLDEEDKTGALIKNDDTSRSYKNQRQYPPRGQRNINRGA